MGGPSPSHPVRVVAPLREAGLTAKPAKCQFGMNRCAYLGHRVGGGLVQPEVGKLQVVQSFPVPTTKRQVRASLALWAATDFTTIAAPLTDLTCKTSLNAVTWTNDCARAFVILKERLCSSPVLHSPDFTLPFVLQTDASERWVGAVLSQHSSEGEGQDHPLAYFSKKLLPREQRYCTVEKECLVIRLGVQAFRVYLLGRHFTVQTDHCALQWLDRLKDTNARLTRWCLALQQFHFSVEHRAGSQNANADGLSRMF